MKFTTVALFAAICNAAPLVKRDHTAPEVTVTVTDTVILSTSENIVTVSGTPPPAATTDVQPTETPTTTPTTTTTTTPTTEASTTEASTTEAPTEAPTTEASSTEAPTTEAPTSEASSTETSSTSSVSASSTSDSSTPTLDAFESEILSEHNKKRALHGVPDLTWDATLAKYAADYAASSFSCDNVQLIHSHGPYGENLAAGYAGGSAPVDAWYGEIKDYDFNKPGYSDAVGHFTQVVWKSTTKLGCARVTCNNVWKQYTICEYSDTSGNISGTDPSTGKSYFELNVLRPI